MRTAEIAAAEDRLIAARVIFVVRGTTNEDARLAAERAIAIGACAVEVTMTVPDAPDLLRSLREYHPEVLLGAGTVTTVQQAREMIRCGASFVVSPGFEPSLLHLAWSENVVMVPGVQTPTEIMAAAREGVQLMKLFPAGPYGPALLRSLLGPFPTTRFVPTGGITSGAAEEWLHAGAVAIGVGVGVDRPSDEDLRRLARLVEPSGRRKTGRHERRCE